MNPQENTSGQGKDAVLPQEIRFYNYGAALFGFFWLLANGLMGPETLKKLRTFEGISFGGDVVLGLGSKGNIVAWKYRPWNSLEQFIRIQRRWNIAGKVSLCVFLTALSLIMLGFIYLFVREFFPGLQLPQI